MKLLDKIDIRKSIQSKLLVSFLLIIILPSVMIGISSYFISVNILTKEVSSSFSQTVLNVRNSVERELYQIKQISDYMFVDKDLKDAILKKHTEPNSSIEAEDRIQKKLENYLIASTFNNIKVIKVYGLNDFEMSFGDSGEVSNLDNKKVKNSEWYKAATQNTGKILWTGVHESFLKERGVISKYSISLFRSIKDPYYRENIGVTYMSLEPQIFSSLTDNFNSNTKSKICILDNSNRIVNSANLKINTEDIIHIMGNDGNTGQQEYIFKEDKKKSLMYFIYYINDFDWKVVGVIPVSELTKDNKVIFEVTAAACVISFIISGVIWFFISFSIVGSVRRLTYATKMVRQGNFDVKVQSSGRDEIGILTSNFNYMVEKINDLLKQVLDEHSRKKDAEYKALQAQINPHFLYNTLNSIRWMAMLQKADNIKRMVDALGRLLRNCTSRVDQYITIEEEINNLKDYVYIQLVAYKNKFQVEWEVDEEILKFKCLKFILQPLVENAIFHGIELKDGYGTILIKIRKQDDSIIFSVWDDGVGITEEQIKNLLDDNSSIVKKFNGIGIGNMHERIQIAYGAQGKFSIDSRPGEYTNIFITIPVIE